MRRTIAEKKLKRSRIRRDLKWIIGAKREEEKENVIGGRGRRE